MTVMAKNKNNIELLVSDDLEDTDPTAELELLDLSQLQHTDDVELESSAQTSPFADAEEDRELSELESDLEDRSKTISKLQYDIEQLRSRWIGLETEIRAREELTDRLQVENDELKQSGRRTARLLKRRNRSIRDLKAQLRDSNESEQAALETADRLRVEVGELNALIKEIDADSLHSLISDQKKRIGDLDDEIETLNAALQQDDTPRYLETIARQSGQLASNTGLIRELQGKFEHAERYADSLRRQLQSRVAIADAAQQSTEHLQLNLDHALAELAQLRGQLDVETDTTDELRQQIKKLHDEHAEEIRVIRFEFDQAQATITQHESLNEELSQNFISAQKSRLEVESRLGKAEETANARVTELEKENKRLEKTIEELNDRLATKSEAINGLMTELKKKQQESGSISEIKHVIQELDERMSSQVGQALTPEKDRITRVLIGSVDGQELRFQLFKDRLTIGRTEQNDIQLDASYVSRRHAVLVTGGRQTRVVDWGSKNGVFVNTLRVTERFLKNGDILGIGTAKFRYEERPKRDN